MKRSNSISLFVLFLFFCIHGVSATAGEVKTYTLEELLGIARENNPEVRALRENLTIGRGLVISSMAYPNPEIELEGGVGSSLEDDATGGEYSLGIAQSFEWPRKRFLRRKAQEVGLEVRRYENDIFLVELAYRVKRAFYKLVLNEKEAEIARENLDIVKKLLDTVKARVEAGESPEFELVKARVESLKAEKDLKRAEKKVMIARRKLRALLGNALPEGFSIKGDFDTGPVEYTRESLVDMAIKNHPLVLKKKEEIKQKNYILEKEKVSVIPDITFRGVYENELDKRSYGVGLSVSIPLWYQKKGEIVRAGGELSMARAELFSTTIEIALAVEEAYRNYEIALAQIDLFEKGLIGQAQEALRIAELSYKYGESGILDYLDAQRVYRETLFSYNLARFELSLAIAQIDRFIGRE